MRAIEMTARWGRATLAVGSLGALIAAGGCGVTREATSAPAQAATAAASQTGLPIVVSCEPTQRTIVRPTIVNGTAMSQVECVAGEAAAAPVPAMHAPMAPAPAIARTLAAQPVVYRDIADTEVVPIATRSSAAPVRARQVVYEEPPGAPERQEERGDHRVLGRRRGRRGRGGRRQEGGAPRRGDRRRRRDAVGPGHAA